LNFVEMAGICLFHLSFLGGRTLECSKICMKSVLSFNNLLFAMYIKPEVVLIFH